MRILLKFSLLALLLTLTACQKVSDETPNSAFKELINIREKHLKMATADNIDSTYLLYGFGFENDDLIAAGKSYFQKVQALENLSDDKKEKANNELDLEYKTLSILDELRDENHSLANKIYCKLPEQECLDNIFNHKEYWQSELDKNGKLLNRYQIFLNSKPAVTDFLLTDKLPSPNYRSLFVAQRLTHLSYLNALELKSENNNGIIKAMDNELTILRKQLKMADNLLQKMIIQRMVLNQLQMRISLKTKYNVNFSNTIENLNTLEKSLELPLAYEFLWIENEMKKSNANLDNYLHYTSYNGIANHYLNQIEISNQSAIEIGKYQANYQETESPIQVSKKGNETGFVLANTAVQNYVNYAQRLNELDNVINMTNFILMGNDKHLINVFTGDNKGIIKDSEKICMPLPKADNDRTQTCVYL